MKTISIGFSVAKEAQFLKWMMTTAPGEATEAHVSRQPVWRPTGIDARRTDARRADARPKV